MSYVLKIHLCAAGNSNTFGQRRDRKTEQKRKSVDYQLGHTNFGQEGQCHLIFEDYLLQLDSFVL